MSNLRLLLWNECNRRCRGCCNKDWDLDNLPIVQSFSGYDMIMLTGGEVMLYPEKVEAVVAAIRCATDVQIIVYTAKSDPAKALLDVLERADGLTLTLHAQKDVKPFAAFQDALEDALRYNHKLQNKSLRLNVFKGVDITGVSVRGWKLQRDMVWVKNCPLPKNEVFMRLSKP
jgi:pyruvate-formate lyase-activating enzyme